MSHVTRMNESCHTYEWVMSHVWKRNVTRTKELFHVCGCVMSHVWISYVTCRGCCEDYRNDLHTATLIATHTATDTATHAATHTATHTTTQEARHTKYQPPMQQPMQHTLQHILQYWKQDIKSIYLRLGMGWLRLVGPFKLYVSFAKDPYKRDDILQKRPII